MNADLLRDAVSRFGDDPDGIGRFRKVVIGLAIAGKLTGEGQNLTPAAMLDEIERQKIRLVSDGLISRPKRYAVVVDEQLPDAFSDPSSFVPLGAIARIEKGLTGIQSATSGNYPLVVTAAERISCDHFDFDGAATIVPLVSSTGHGNASINRLHYQEGKFALGTILAAIFPYAPDLISARFIFEYLSTFKEEVLVSRMTGTANVTLNVGRIAEVPIPLICPTVQRKADELMALCDQLEAARAEREAARDTFTLSTLAKLNTPDPETFGEDARLALANLAPLTTRADQIKQLRQTILNLAVRGKLVKQDESDEPVSALLQRLGKSHAADQCDAETDLLPPSWELVRVDDCFIVSGGMQKTPARAPKNHAFPYLGVSNVYRGQLDLSTVKQFELVDGELERFRLVSGDILVVEGNGSASEIGRCAVWRDEIENCVHQNHIIRCRPRDQALTPYVVLYLNSPDGMSEMTSLAITSAGLYSLSVGKIRKIPLPLPPLAEQHRIVAKVDELMALCDQLETSLTTGEQARSRLLEAVLHNALEPALP